jgi:AraC-like DNA-binding protein
MKRAVNFILLLSVILTPRICAQEEKDKEIGEFAKPYGTFILPAPNAVIAQNIVKIAVPQIIEQDTLRKVNFFVYYSRYISNKIDKARVDTLIGVDSVAPFEILWDCSGIPDQDQSNLHFYCKVVTTRGEKKGGFRSFHTSAHLDRNREYSAKEWKSFKTNAKIEIDGDISDWPDVGSVVFEHQDNRVEAFSVWNQEYLYFGIGVRDHKLFPPDENADHMRLAKFMIDGIELFFDLKHDRNINRRLDDRQVIVPIFGEYSKIVYTSEKNEERAPGIYRKWNPVIKVKRADKKYFVEAAFSWEQFGVKPFADLTMGINLVNSDREDANGVVATASWAGISDLLHHNPSEWANLRLVDPSQNGKPQTAIIIVMMILMGAGIILAYRKGKVAGKEESIEIPMQEKLIDSAKEFLKENYADEKVGIKEAASHVNLSPDYFRKLFKKFKKENFADYLNNLRIQKARELLSTTNKRITEVAFGVGYSSLEYFNKVFKSREGLTPSEYRKRHFSK